LAIGGEARKEAGRNAGAVLCSAKCRSNVQYSRYGDSRSGRESSSQIPWHSLRRAIARRLCSCDSDRAIAASTTRFDAANTRPISALALVVGLVSQGPHIYVRQRYAGARGQIVTDEGNWGTLNAIDDIPIPVL
jgi:hypothetical protein